MRSVQGDDASALAGRAVLVTGGAGFIGSALVRHLVRAGARRVVCLDALTYAGSRLNVAKVADVEGEDGTPRLAVVHADVRDRAALDAALAEHRPSVVFHLAAETHVDRSIDGPLAFVHTNVTGTATLLEAARAHWAALGSDARAAFRFVHVSTDEVYGALGAEGAFTEATPYDPSSPYSASKAASDHLARAWHRTYGLPVVVTNCSNNYGPYQYPEKLLPVTVLRALRGEALAVDGSGANVRDWLHVDDHVAALCRVAEAGRVGQTYNVGGGAERTTLDVVRAVCARLDAVRPKADGTSYADQIALVEDRPGHDFRYAIDASKLAAELGWAPRATFEEGLAETVDWYVGHLDWCDAVLDANLGTQRIGTAGTGSGGATRTAS